MTQAVTGIDRDIESRARMSLGHSSPAVYAMAVRAISACHRGGGTLLDVGCGDGNLWVLVHDHFDRYIGVDAVKYDRFPRTASFERVNLDAEPIPLPEGSADVVAGVEIIEHLENPRAFVRELARLVKPGGWVILTTPNQLSLLSLLTLVVKRQFVAFQDNAYPAHLTALLEIDLRRIAAECGLVEVGVGFSASGRIPLSAWRYPTWLARRFPRALSDNLLLKARRPHA